MNDRFNTQNPELDELFERYRVSPASHVFAPLADACRKAGMIDEALEICARGVAANPRYASGFVVQGKCLYDAGRAGDAETVFRRVLDLDRNNLVALKYLGIIHAERGESARAKDYFDHILALDPENREIRGRIAEVEDAPAVSARELAGVPPTGAAKAAAPREIKDDTFEGEPITLRDESVTPDEIATMTLADIYASQGYVSKALKIYREVHRRQGNNDALRAKIEALEAREAKEPVLAAAPDDVAPAAAPAPAPAAPPVAARKPEPEAVAARSDAHAPVAGTPQGAPIDESRSYEQFKRWLKAMSD